jgi:outer membrane protein assembly factor BamB
MKNLLFIILFCIGSTAHAQSELWAITVSKGAFMNQLEDGKIFLKDKTNISLINNKTGEIEWENKVATQSNPEFLTDLPIMFFEGNSYAVIDATTGYIIDQNSAKTTILNISYFLEKGRVVLELARNKHLHILNIDLKNLSKSWSTDVGPAQKVGLGLFVRASENPPSITNNGSLVIVDKKYISILTKKGKVRQRLEFNKNLKALGFNKKVNTLYVIEDKKKLHFIDVSTGIAKAFVLLKDNNIKLRVFGDGSNIGIVQKKEIGIHDAANASQIGSYEFKTKIKEAYVDEESGKLYVLAKYKLIEIDESGKVRKSVSFKKEFNDIYYVYGKTILSGPSGSSPVDLKTLKFEYPKLPNIPPIDDYIEFGDYIGYTHYAGERFKFNVIDKNGDIVWDKSYNSFTIPSVDVIGDGLLIVSGSEVTYVSTETGESIWNDKVKVNASFTYGVDEATNDMYMYSDKRLYKFDYSNGTLSRSEDKFKFKDFDYETLQPQLFVLPDAIFMKGSNTVFVLEKDGTLKHEKTYKRTSNGSTILQLVNVVFTAIAIGTGNAGEVVSVYSDNQVIHQGGMVDVLNDSWDYAEQMKYNRRLKQNRSSNIYPYVFTKLEDDKRGLIFINPSDGEERFSILLDEKNPTYIVDDYDGVLFHLNKTSLKAYDLK